MNDDKRPSLKKPDILFLSFFGVGFAPFAPGTFGTLATLPFLYALGRFNPPFFFFIPFILILTFVSSFIAEHVQKKYSIHDPQWIVIDEVIGMSITWLFTKEHTLFHLIIQFGLFRFFDIVKVWPASFFDKKITHGAGTILDDVVSGIYAGLVYLIIYRFIAV
jgi:phosphatidylglycerophosphatase A